MTRRSKITGLIILVAVLAVAVLTPVVMKTVTLARVGAAYSAKVLCSGALMAGMDPERLLDEELAAARGVVSSEILEDRGEVVSEALFGRVSARAVRQGTLGCSLYVDGRPPVTISSILRAGGTSLGDREVPWRIDPAAGEEPPSGIDSESLDSALQAAFGEPDPENPRRTRAVVVVHDGWVVAEQYVPGIDPTTPLAGYSMGKSVTHALVGRAIADGTLVLNQPIPAPEWSAPGDPRQTITLDHLLRMSSGLTFREAYADLSSDVIVMLTSVRDAGAFAANKPLEFEPGTHWAYSSGTTNIISRGLRLAIGDDDVYWRFPYETIFGPADMRTAVLETDPSGTFVGSSYAYASARDWARFGVLYLNNGLWGERRLLPEGWVEQAVTPTPGSNQSYGAHWWINAGGELPDIPLDEYRAEGFDGQYVMVIPSRSTVIVRLGQTPGSDRGASSSSGSSEGFDINGLGKAVLDALPGNAPQGG